MLLLWPETRIALGSYETSFAGNLGARVRDIINRYGPGLDVELRTDTKAKTEWAIHKYGGGMICKGRGGPLTGRPADLLILDDVIKNSSEAQSNVILENLWEWYQTVAYSRLGPRAPIILVGTRWCANDLHGRLEKEEKVGGEKFKHVHFHAIAKKDDILGRKPGEALWPERVPLVRLQRIAKTRPRWFKACWQGEPEETIGLHFRPREWPKYTDVGDAWRVLCGMQWNNYRKADCTIVHAVDWAQAGKKDSNKTAIVTVAITPDGKALSLNVLNETLRYEENAPALEKLCRLYSKVAGGDGRMNPTPVQQVVASDDDMLSDAMAVECRRYRAIPEIRRLAIKSKAKIVRAQAAIIRSQAGLFLVPEPQAQWFEEMADQLASFSGEDGAEDDVADCYGILGRIADEWVPGTGEDEFDSVMGSTGYSGGYGNIADKFGGW